MYCDNCGAELPEGRTDCPRCGSGDKAGRTVVRLGRAPDNDVVLEASSVSRYHAELRRDPAGRVLLTDLHSQAGTFVDGRRVAEQLLGPTCTVSLGTACVSDEVLRAALARLTAPAPNVGRPVDVGADHGAREAVGSRTLAGVRRSFTQAWTVARQPVSLGGVVTLGVLNVLFGAVGLALPALLWLGWRLDEAAPGGATYLLVAAAAAAAHQVVLFLGGLGLILLRRWGRIVSLVWASISCTVALGMAGMAVFGAPLAFGELGQAVVLAIAGVLIVYPALLLFLLNIPSYQAALRRGGRGGGSGSHERLTRGPTDGNDGVEGCFSGPEGTRVVSAGERPRVAQDAPAEARR